MERYTTLLTAARRLAYLLLIALISGWLPQPPIVAALPAALPAPVAHPGGALSAPPAAPAPLTVPAVVDPQLPTL